MSNGRRGSIRSRMKEENNNNSSSRQSKRSLRSKLGDINEETYHSDEILDEFENDLNNETNYNNQDSLDNEDDWFQTSSKNTRYNQKKNWYEEIVDSLPNDNTNKEDTQQSENPYNISEEFDFVDEELETVKLKDQWEKEQSEKRIVLITRITNIFLILGCIYMIFLIFGVGVTSFQYSDNGKVEPQIMSANDIKEKKHFDVVKVEYEKCQMEYEKILILNYRMEHSNEDVQKIATDFEPLKKEIQDLYQKQRGLVVDSKYEPCMKIMQDFLDYAQQYCGFMSTGYTMNDEGKIASARALWYGGNNNQTGEVITPLPDKFVNLHQNVVSMGEGLKGVDMLAIKQWRPDTYVDEYINGKVEDK